MNEQNNNTETIGRAQLIKSLTNAAMGVAAGILIVIPSNSMVPSYTIVGVLCLAFSVVAAMSVVLNYKFPRQSRLIAVVKTVISCVFLAGSGYIYLRSDQTAFAIVFFAACLIKLCLDAIVMPLIKRKYP